MSWADKDVLTPQNLNSKSGAVFNVKDPDFGAVGDGVTNDATAIQAAISAARAVGGSIVHFPAGTYLVSSSLNVNGGGITLRGVGGGLGIVGSTILYEGSSYALGLNADPAGTLTSDPINVRDLRLDGNNLGAFGIQIGKATGSPKSAQVELRRLHVTGFTTAGIISVAAQVCSFYDVQAYLNVGAAGFLFDSITATGGANTTVKLFGCRGFQNAIGIHIKEGDVIIDYGGTYETNTQEAVLIEKTTGFSLSNLQFHGTWMENNQTASDSGLYSFRSFSNDSTNAEQLLLVGVHFNGVNGSANKLVNIGGMKTLTLLGNRYLHAGVTQPHSVIQAGVDAYGLREDVSEWSLVGNAKMAFVQRAPLGADFRGDTYALSAPEFEYTDSAVAVKKVERATSVSLVGAAAAEDAFSVTLPNNGDYAVIRYGTGGILIGVGHARRYSEFVLVNIAGTVGQTQVVQAGAGDLTMTVNISGTAATMELSTTSTPSAGTVLNGWVEVMGTSSFVYAEL